MPYDVFCQTYDDVNVNNFRRLFTIILQSLHLILSLNMSELFSLNM